MATPAPILLTLLILVVAVLYASVGHGGASGYLAALALAGTPPDVMRPAALVLNVIVSLIALVQFIRAGHFHWPLLWPFAFASVPMAFVGGLIHVPPAYYKPLLGAVLLFSSWRLAARLRPRAGDGSNHLPPRRAVALSAGAALGLLSGLSGTGGGIFLSPLLILTGWAGVKRTAATSAAFILINSLSGLAGLLTSGRPLPANFTSSAAPWAVAAVIGGATGSWLGARKFDTLWLRRLLALVLLVAGGKLIISS